MLCGPPTYAKYVKDVAPPNSREVYNAPNFGPVPTDPAALRVAARLAAPKPGEQRSSWMIVAAVVFGLARIPDAFSGGLGLQNFTPAVCLTTTAVYGWINPVRLDTSKTGMAGDATRD